MHSSNSRAVHFAPPAGGLLNAQGAQGRPLHTSPAKFLCIFLSCCYFETTRLWESQVPYGWSVPQAKMMHSRPLLPSLMIRLKVAWSFILASSGIFLSLPLKPSFTSS